MSIKFIFISFLLFQNIIFIRVLLRDKMDYNAVCAVTVLKVRFGKVKSLAFITILYKLFSGVHYIGFKICYLILHFFNNYI